MTSAEGSMREVYAYIDWTEESLVQAGCVYVTSGAAAARHALAALVRELTAAQVSTAFGHPIDGSHAFEPWQIDLAAQHGFTLPGKETE